MKLFLLFSQVSAGRQPGAMETMLSQYSVILMNFSKCNNILIIKPTALWKSKEKSQHPPQSFEPFLSWLRPTTTQYWILGRQASAQSLGDTRYSSSAFGLFLCSPLHPILWTLHYILSCVFSLLWVSIVWEKRERPQSLKETIECSPRAMDPNLAPDKSACPGRLLPQPGRTQNTEFLMQQAPREQESATLTSSQMRGTDTSNSLFLTLPTPLTWGRMEFATGTCGC